MTTGAILEKDGIHDGINIYAIKYTNRVLLCSEEFVQILHRADFILCCYFYTCWKKQSQLW